MKRNIWAAPLVSALIIVSGATSALADDPDFYENGNRRGVVLRDSQITVTGDTAGSATVDVGEVPDCWYEPQEDASKIEAWVRERFQSDRRAGVQLPGTDDITKHRGEDGKFWTPAFMDTAAGVSCAEDLAFWVWVPAGEAPPAPGVTPEMLARIARAYLDVPEPVVEVNPAARSYVELGTWVWADAESNRTRRVTATLGDMSATVVAVPGDLTIDAGTTYATEHACEGIGTPYPKGADAGDAKREPPCGVTYHRASPGGSYPMVVSMHWDVTWEETGDDMTDVDVGTTVPVEVDEIQTRNQGG